MVCGICKKEGHNRVTCKYSPQNFNKSGDMLLFEESVQEKRKNDKLTNELTMIKKRIRNLTNDYDNLLNDLIKGFC